MVTMRYYPYYVLVAVMFPFKSCDAHPGHQRRGLQDSSSSSSCPFAPKLDIPSADGPLQSNPGPRCTADMPAVAERQLLFDAYCEHYNFVDNGDAANGSPVCIEAQDQFVPDEVKGCTHAHETKCLGPLAQLVGRWEGDAGLSFNWVPVYDPMSQPRPARTLPAGGGRVPQQPMTDATAFLMEYKEVIVFAPIVGDVKNRGVSNADHINSECQMDQSLHGVTYTLQIQQTSPSNVNGNVGDVIHEENGMYMCKFRYCFVC